VVTGLTLDPSYGATLGALGNRYELIATPPDRADVAWLAPIVAQRPAQQSDPLGDGLVGDGHAPPDFCDQLIMRDDVGGAADQQRQGGEGEIGNRELLITTPNSHRTDIDQQIVDPKTLSTMLGSHLETVPEG
jgi:hypothetical protein